MALEFQTSGSLPYTIPHTLIYHKEWLSTDSIMPLSVLF